MFDGVKRAWMDGVTCSFGSELGTSQRALPILFDECLIGMMQFYCSFVSLTVNKIPALEACGQMLRRRNPPFIAVLGKTLLAY